MRVSHIFTMPARLIIDLAASTVAVRRAEKVLWTKAKPKWVEFYTVLAIARMQEAGDGWVTAEMISKLDAWRSIKLPSVGKIIAREVKESENRYETQIIQTFRRTKRWRLCLPTANITLLPSVEYATGWLRDRGHATSTSRLCAAWVDQAVRAQILFQQGFIPEARSRASNALHLPDVDIRLRRIAGVVYVRAAAMQGEIYDAREEVESYLSEGGSVMEEMPWGHDALGRFFASRLIALEAIESDAASAESHLPSLQRRLEHADASENLTTQVILHNTIGVLAMRLERFAQAEYHLREAIVVGVAIADLFTVSGAIFNYSVLMLRQSEITSDSPVVTEIETLLTLAVDMNRTVGASRNSAQAEILLGRVLTGIERVAEAERLLQEASEIAAANGSAYDRGCMLKARARLVMKRVEMGEVQPAEGRALASELLGQAEAAFRESGRLAWRSIADDHSAISAIG